jgi:hypothetical protein
MEFVEGALGRKEVRKRAQTAGEAVRVRREADLLDVAAHPGLVEVAGFEDGEHPELRTSRIDGTRLADHASSLDVEEVAGVVAAVAATLADLHGMGLVHGAVAPEHVLLDGDGRPVLCSLGYGGLVGEGPSIVPSLAAPYLAPARMGGEPLDPSFDVFSLGALLASLLPDATGHARAGSVDALRRIAEQVTAGSGRLTARQVADAVHDAVPGARLPGTTRATVPPRPRSDPLATRRHHIPLEGWRRTLGAGGRRRARSGLSFGRAAGVVVMVAGVLGGVLLVARQGRLSADPPAVVMPPTTALSTTTTPVTTTVLSSTTRPTATTPSTTAAPRRSGCPVVAGPLSADVDGDGCPDVVRFGDGVVEAAGRRWAVGEPGDVMTVGDWTCAGTRSVAVLRPRTGEVFAFSGWASAGRDLTAALVGEVAGGQAIRPADIDGDGCNELVVERRSGAPAVLHPPRSSR